MTVRQDGVVIICLGGEGLTSEKVKVRVGVGMGEGEGKGGCWCKEEKGEGEVKGGMVKEGGYICT